LYTHTSDNTRGVHNQKKQTNKRREEEFSRKWKKGEALFGTRSY